MMQNTQEQPLGRGPGPFKTLRLSDQSWVRGLLDQAGERGCEYSFSCILMWQEVYRLSAAEIEGCLAVCSLSKGSPAYLFPAGPGDKRAAIEALDRISREAGVALRFYSATAAQCQFLESLYPGEFRFTPTPNVREYVYEADSLITLGGQKLHAKRNFINRFIREHPDWRFEQVGPDNLGECREMYEEWMRSLGEEAGKGLRQESAAVETALEHYTELGLKGGLIRAGDAVCAFAMGEPLGGGTFDVRIEKARYDMPGAYAIINREFAAAFCGESRYINREDDAGDEGLRKAKLSYRPAWFIDKFTARRN